MPRNTPKPGSSQRENQRQSERKVHDKASAGAEGNGGGRVEDRPGEPLPSTVEACPPDRPSADGRAAIGTAPSDPVARRMTDIAALALHRQRAIRSGEGGLFLHRIAATEIKDRIRDVNRSFTRVAVVSPFPAFWRQHFPDAVHVSEGEVLDLPQGRDLVIHAMSLHWANDPVGQLIQCRQALVPDGLFIGAAFAEETLKELRAALAEAEIATMGGLSPRVAPMGEIRDLGNLLMRADFALPVADLLHLEVRHADALALMHDLRAMGETNALADRHRRPPPRSFFALAAALMAERFGEADGRIRSTFDLAFLTGWAPHPDQPKPLRPGSAEVSLAQVLGKGRGDGEG